MRTWCCTDLYRIEFERVDWLSKRSKGLELNVSNVLSLLTVPLRNGPDKNDSNNGNEHVGMQKRC